MTQDKPRNALTKALVKETPASDFPVGNRSPVYWTLFVLSLAPILACVAMWLLILKVANTPTHGGFDLGPLIGLLYLLLGIGVAFAVSGLFSIIGLCYVWFAARRFDRAFGWLLALNVATVAIPILGVIAHDWHEKSISLVRAVESGNAHRLDALLATRQRSPHPDEAHLAMTAAVEAGNVEMVDALVCAYREKWPRDTADVNTYEKVLVLAAAKSKVGLVRTLLERGVDPNQCRFGFHNEKSLLDFEETEARRTNDWRIVHLLRSHGAR
jgi:hypothetical protein